MWVHDRGGCDFCMVLKSKKVHWPEWNVLKIKKEDWWPGHCFQIVGPSVEEVNNKYWGCSQFQVECGTGYAGMGKGRCVEGDLQWERRCAEKMEGLGVVGVELIVNFHSNQWAESCLQRYPEGCGLIEKIYDVEGPSPVQSRLCSPACVAGAT